MSFTPEYFYTKPDGQLGTKSTPVHLSHEQKWELWEEVNANSKILEGQCKFYSHVEIGFFLILVLICLRSLFKYESK